MFDVEMNSASLKYLYHFIYSMLAGAKMVVTNTIETHHHHATCFPRGLLVQVPPSSSLVK